MARPDSKDTLYSAVVMVLVWVMLLTPSKNMSGQDEVAPDIQQIATETNENSVFVIMCNSDPSQIIVLDSNGEWVPSVRTATLKIEVGKPAKLTCVMWSGQFKPTTPTTKTWELSQIKTVDTNKFQEYVDALQEDPKAIAKGQ